MNRRAILRALPAIAASSRLAWALRANGERLAAAARAQIGVTVSYDPNWTSITYPNGDVPRTTGVCADVVIRAARDGLGLDLQRLVHEDMTRHFESYPARRVWHSQRPDANIDHRRVLNLETYFQRSGACLWHSSAPVAGDAFPRLLDSGDLVTWLLDARLPHIGIVVSDARRSGSESITARNSECPVVHNIGRGVEQSPLSEFRSHRAIGHYRWPAQS